jgi:hypothetical protein
MLLAVSYLQGVLTTTFYSDDFPALVETKATALSLVSDTRPIWGGGLFLLFSFTKLTGLYIIPKIIGFLGLILLYRYICNLFKESDSRRTHYLIIALGFLLPSFGIWSHWSIALFHSWGALFGVIAIEKFRSGSRIIPVTAMTVSCLIYPPATVFFFGVVFYRGIALRRTNSELRRESLAAIKLLTLAGITSLIISFSLIKVLGLNPTPRVAIVNLTEFPNKLIWFFSHPFALGFFPISVHSPSISQLVFVGFPVLLMVLFAIAKGGGSSALQLSYRLTLFFIIALLSICPLLVTNDNQVELRLQPGMSWGILCSSLYGVYIFTKVYFKSSHKLLYGIFIFVIVCLSFVGVTQRFQNFYHFQDQVSTDFIVSSIRTCEQGGNLNSILIAQNTSSFPSMPYLGTFSMTSDMASNWVPRNKIIFTLQRFFPEYSEVPILMASTDSSTCIFDLEKFVYLVSISERKLLL